MTQVIRQLRRLRYGRLAANATRGTAMLGVRLSLQALYFLLLARLLGAHQFGIFSGTWVLFGFLATFSGLGFPVLAFRTMALTPESAPACAGRGFRVIGWTAIPLTLLAALIAFVAFRERPGIVAICMLAFSEVVVVPTITLLSSLHQGGERLGRSQSVMAVLWGARLAAALAAFAVFRQVDLQLVALVHTCATLLTAAAWLFVDRHQLISPLKAEDPNRGELLVAVSFAISGAATIASTELNQSLVLAQVGAASAGVLAVAYKFVAVSSAPLSALCQAASPRLLRAAQDGPEHLWTRGMALAIPVLGAAFGCALTIYLGSHLIGRLFGTGYSQSELLARHLAILPVFMAVRLVSVYLLMAASRQRVRVIAELACLAFGVLLNVALIESKGLDGAIVAILLTESTSAIIMSWLAFRTSGRPLPHHSTDK